MATTASFKQQCPSCEAMVPIRDPKLVGRKIDCPKCKYRFVVEDPGTSAEEEAPRKKRRGEIEVLNAARVECSGSLRKHVGLVRCAQALGGNRAAAGAGFESGHAAGAIAGSLRKHRTVDGWHQRAIWKG